MIGIIGAMEDEVVLLRAAMKNSSTENAGVFTYVKGMLEGREAVLLRCGIGKVNAAVGCALMIDRFKPDLVINTGSAGGIDPALTFGDVIIAEGLLYHDVDVTAFKYKPGQVPGQPQVFPVPAGLVSLAENSMDELKREKALPENLRHVRGLVGSGDVFMHRAERIEAVRNLFPGMKAVEMEGAAIAHACSLFNVPAIVIRALSDIAGADSPETSEEFLPAASKNSAELVRRITKNFCL
jgi:adenosylhomocysteine nucleosidase